MKKILITVLSVMLAGVALMVIGLAGMDFDWKKLDTNKYVSRSEYIREPFDSVRLTATTTDVEISVSTSQEALVTGRESEMYPLTVAVEDGTLVISQGDITDDNWLKTGFLLKNKSIIVTLPEKVYKSLQIQTTTGDITVSQKVQAEHGEVKVTTGAIRIDGKIAELNVQATTGDIRFNGETDWLNAGTTTGRIILDGISPDRVRATATTGDIRLSEVRAGEMICQTTTGSIRLTDCDARNITLKATTGDIRGTLLTGKQFKASSAAGSVSCPNDSGEDICTASTATGAIHLQINTGADQSAD